MRMRSRLFVIPVLFLGAAIGPACSSVPQEVVELSQTVGTDLGVVHASYRTLIKTHFDDLRRQVNDFIDYRWTPKFVEKFIEEGQLKSWATNEDPNMVLLGVKIWAETAIERIGQKRSELLTPIDKDEQALMESVDAAFGQIVVAQAAITAHLRSLRGVQEMQDRVLEDLKLKKFRDEVNGKLIATSNSVQTAIERVDKAQKKLEPANTNPPDND